MLSITAIILTYNEEKNIKYTLTNIVDLVKYVYIVDSFSNDKTIEIVKSFTSNIFFNKFENNSKQLNWALRNLPIRTDWVLRLDSDESLTEELKKELIKKLPSLREDKTGVFFKRRVYFMNKWIRYGGYYPVWLLRLWRNGAAYCENRWMDEHVKLIKGKFAYFDNDFIDNNHNSLHWWINKHNSYATREAVDILNNKLDFFAKDVLEYKSYGGQIAQKRWVKENIYFKSPLFLRAFFYFFYRYFIRLGFLDGMRGLIWHFLQGLWYRFLVDAKVYEIRKLCGNDKNKIIAFLKTNYGIEI